MRAAHRLHERLGFEPDPARDPLVDDPLVDRDGEPGVWLRGLRLRLDGAPPRGQGR